MFRRPVGVARRRRPSAGRRAAQASMPPTEVVCVVALLHEPSGHVRRSVAAVAHDDDRGVPVERVRLVVQLCSAAGSSGRAVRRSMCASSHSSSSRTSSRRHDRADRSATSISGAARCTPPSCPTARPAARPGVSPTTADHRAGRKHTHDQQLPTSTTMVGTTSARNRPCASTVRATTEPNCTVVQRRSARPGGGQPHRQQPGRDVRSARGVVATAELLEDNQLRAHERSVHPDRH